MSGTSNLPFERLKGRENFGVWRIGAKAHLITKGHWPEFNLDVAALSDDTKKSANLKALAELTLLLDSSVYTYIEDCKTAKAAWNALGKAFEDSGAVRKVTLLKQWITLRLSDFGSMQEYVNQCLVLRSRVKSAGFEIAENVAGSIMLCGLPDEFKSLVMGIESKSEEITVDYVKNILLQEVDFNRDGETAMAVKNKKFGKKNKNVKCYDCQGPHYRNKCPLRKKNGSGDIEKSNVVLYSAFMARDNSSTNNWYIDSGATAHMTRDKTILLEKVKAKNSDVKVANNERLSIECVGKVRQRVNNDGNLSEITLENVQYIPEICENLISVSQIVKKGNKVLFDINGVKIFDSNKRVIATGSLIDNMFKLDVARDNYAFSIKCDIDTFNLWHRRLGHASASKLNLLLQTKMNSKDLKCVICCEGKQSRRPFISGEKKTRNLLELIHTDVCGPITPQSIGGARYFITFIDDCSRKVFVYVMKSKGEAFSKFVHFKNFVEKQIGASIKTLRSDGGKEYDNIATKNFCAEHGIKYEKTAPYSPQQNGVSERMNRTIVEKVRCMLYDAEMSKGFWAEALFAAINIINVLPNSAIENRIPNEVWYGKKCDISDFKIFGSKVMAMIPQHKRRKLDKKSIECIYLRKADDANAYRLYNKNTKKTVVSRDVVFFENDRLNESATGNEFFHDFSMDTEEPKEACEPIADSGGENASDESTIENTIVNESNGSDVDGTFIDASDNLNANSTMVNAGDNTSQDVTEGDISGVETDNEQLDPTYVTRAQIPTNSEPPRTRSNFPLSLLNLHVALFANEPKTYKQAIECEENKKWSAAMRDEYESLVKNDTWKLVERPKNRNIVDNRWIFKVKQNSDGSIDRYKARLVARGFTQEYGFDYMETFSPVVRFTSIRIILSIAAQRKMKLRQFDVKTAFLNGDLKEEIYMEQPVGFSDGSDKVCKLQRSLYGLKQASRCWNEKFKNFIQLFGFIACKADPCVFVSRKNGQLIVLAIHVDDGLIISDSMESIECVLNFLRDQFEIKSMNVGCFLGLEIEQKSDGSIFVHQTNYAKRVLEKFNMENCNSVATPSDSNKVLHDFADSEPCKYPYREAVGSLMYLSVATRPDITYAVAIASRYLENPTVVHVNAIKRIFKYLKNTIHFGIFYVSGGENQLIGYSDADHAGDIETRRSTSGYIFKFNDGVISWSSERQKSVSISTMEAEYIAASEATRELVWIRRLLDEILENDLNVPLYFMDNQSAIKLIKNPEFHKRSKHIDIRYHFVREKFEEGEFVLEYVSSNNMIADIFTKPLPREKFNYLRTLTGVVSNS